MAIIMHPYSLIHREHWADPRHSCRKRGCVKPIRFSLVLVALVLGLSSVAAASDDILTYTFNAADQLVQVGWQHGALADFTYDGDRLRVSKTVGSEEVIYVRGASGEVLAEYAQDGALIAEYVYSGGRRVCKIVPVAGGGEERIYYHGDMVGTPLVTTDDNGAEVFRGEYFPFGTEYLADGEADRYQFTGKELDEEIGLHYFHARYYDSRIGRFISVDPVGGSVGSSQSWNRYAYVENNPVKLVDPDGEFPWLIIPVVVGAILGAEYANAPGAVDDPILTAPETQNLGLAMFEGSIIGVAAGAAADYAFEKMIPSHEPTPGLTPAPQPCFAAGTVVATADGHRPIEEIEVGDQVWGFDEESGRIGLHEVTARFVHQSDHLRVLSVGGSTLRTTDNHPFWLDDSWQEASILESGDWLKARSGSLVAIESAVRLDGSFTVYNIEVDEAHTYFVSPMNVLVHNKAATPRKSSRAIRKEWEKTQGEPWPKDSSTGRNQDVVHKNALADGGTNELDNIEPKPHDMHVKEHKDAGDFKRWGARSKKKEQ